MVYEGIKPAEKVEDDLAIAAYNLLSNGMGGIDWYGIEIVAAKLGIDDIDDLIDRLHAIKTHSPPKAGDPPPPSAPTGT